MDTLTLQLLIEKMATETDKEKILNLKQEIDTFLFGKGMFGNAWIKIENVGSIQNLKTESHLYKKEECGEEYFKIIQNFYAPVPPNRLGSVYIRPGYTGVDILLALNDEYAYLCHIKSGKICLRKSCMKMPFANEKQIGEFFKRCGIPCMDSDINVYFMRY